MAAYAEGSTNMEEPYVVYIEDEHRVIYSGVN